MKSEISSHLMSVMGYGFLTLVLLALCTWGELRLEDASGVNRPYTIFYLIPVAIAAALLGVRGGVLAALAAIVLARIYLFSDNKHGLSLLSSPHIGEVIEFFALLVGTLAIGIITGRLRSALGQVHRTNADINEANRRLRESEELRRVFNRDVLLAVTGGKLRLIAPDEMPPSDLASKKPTLTQTLREPLDASNLRQTLIQLGQRSGLDTERISDLCTAATEAATNAIKHGNGGLATVWTGGDSVTVQIEDHGSGISPTHLARATLEQGFSTRVSLGMGFHLMLQSTDSLSVCTDTGGTTIVLYVSNKPRPTIEDAVLARYANMA